MTDIYDDLPNKKINLLLQTIDYNIYFIYEMRFVINYIIFSVSDIVYYFYI